MPRFPRTLESLLGLTDLAPSYLLGISAKGRRGPFQIDVASAGSMKPQVWRFDADRGPPVSKLVFDADTNDIERIGRLVRDLHLPVTTGL